jgi:FCD domain
MTGSSNERVTHPPRYTVVPHHFAISGVDQGPCGGRKRCAPRSPIRPRCGHKISSIASQFGVPAPNRLLVAVDFTYVKLIMGMFVYFAFVVDANAGPIMGWEASAGIVKLFENALTRLGEQGLAVACPQRGFRVRPLSVADIAGLTESRVEIESVALRLAIERGDVQWETGVVAAYHLLERTPVVNDSPLVDEWWAARHSDFHRALIAGCSNRRLQAVVEGLRDSAELYRRWYWALAGDHHRDLTAEQRELKGLSLARNAGPAIEAP